MLYLQGADHCLTQQLCCFDPIVLVSVATQTDDVPNTVASHNSSNGSSLVKTQANFNVPAEEWKISHDHNYSMSIPMAYPIHVINENSLTPYEEIEGGPLVENIIDNDLNDKDVYDDDNDDDYKDPNWNLSNGKKILLPY